MDIRDIRIEAPHTGLHRRFEIWRARRRLDKTVHKCLKRHTAGIRPDDELVCEEVISQLQLREWGVVRRLWTDLKSHIERPGKDEALELYPVPTVKDIHESRKRNHFRGRRYSWHNPQVSKPEMPKPRLAINNG